MTCVAAVGVHDDLTTGEAGVALGAADHKAAGGVDIVLGVLVQQLGGNDLLNDLAADVLASDVREILTRRPDIAVITVICGSYQDYQGYDAKKKLLEEAGAIVPASNAQAVELALKLLKK